VHRGEKQSLMLILLRLAAMPQRHWILRLRAEWRTI